MEKDALDDCGRLKPGYRYLKGGQVEKVEKKEAKKTASVKKKNLQKQSRKAQKRKKLQ